MEVIQCTVHKLRTAKIGYYLESLCKKMLKPFLQTPMIFLHAFVISILNIFCLVRISVEEMVSLFRLKKQGSIQTMHH
jgi:hypothetical protein